MFRQPSGDAVVKRRAQAEECLPNFIGGASLVTGDHGGSEILKVTLLHQPPPALGQFSQTAL